MAWICLGGKGAVLIWSMVLLLLMAVAGVASDWPRFQKNETNVGYTTDAAPLGVNFAWRAPTASAVDVVSVVGGNNVFVLAKGNSVYSINKTTGVRNWVVTSLNTGGNALSTPAYDKYNNTLYVATAGSSSNAKLHAINASNGNIIWSVNVKKHDGSNENGQPNTPVLFYNNSTSTLTDDVVMFGTWASPGTYYCYNAATGDPAWNRTSTNTKGYYWAGAALIGKYAVYGDDNGNLTSVEWDNYRNWNVTNADELDTGSGEIRSSISWKATNATYGYLFFTNRTGYKQTKLGFSTSTGKFNQLDWSANYTRYSTSTPTVYDDNEYVGGGNFSTGGNALLNVNVSNMSNQHWAYLPNGAVQSSPAVSIQNGVPYIYFTTNCQYGRFYCVKDNDTSGVLQWNFTTLEDGKVDPVTHWWLSAQLQGVAISDNWVYGGNDGGYTYGLSNVTPKAYKNQSSAKPPTVCNDPNTEFTATEYAKIRVLDGVYQSDSSASQYAAHRFNFSIDTPVANVTMINVTWVGIGYNENSTPNNGATLYIWNSGVSGGYEQLDTSTSDEVITLTGGVVTATPSDYINSGNVTVLVEQNSAGDPDEGYLSWIKTDYVKVILTVQ